MEKYKCPGKPLSKIDLLILEMQECYDTSRIQNMWIILEVFGCLMLSCHVPSHDLLHGKNSLINYDIKYDGKK